MSLGAAAITSIVSGVSDLSSSFLNFGASIYASNHAQPVQYNQGDIVIKLPERQQQQGISWVLVVVIVIIVILAMIAGYMLLKRK